MAMTWTINNFKAHYPSGGAAVVTADNVQMAIYLLEQELERAGLKQKIKPEQLIPMVTTSRYVRILCDGDYNQRNRDMIDEKQPMTPPKGEQMPQTPEQFAKVMGFADEIIEEQKREIEALKRRNNKLEQKNNSLQSKIDWLMMEWCPEEMTKEQLEEFEKHIRPVDDE